MTLRTYLALLRPRSIFAPGFFLGGLIFDQFAPGGEHRAGAHSFVTLILLGPILLGYVLSQTIQAPMHVPFSIILPNFRRNLLQWHLPLLAVIALVLATLYHGHDRNLPLPVAASVAFAGLCLMLPREPVGRWFGSLVLSGIITGFYLVVALFARETRSAMQSAPWLTFALNLGVAVLCCWLGFSRQRLRFRAHTRLLTLGAAFDPEEIKQHGRLALDRSHRTGRAWTGGAVGDSTTNWLRVVLHETYGFSGGWIRWSLKLTLGYLTIFPVCLYFLLTRIPMRSGPAGSFGQLIYQLVWEPHVSGSSADAGLCTMVTAPLFLSVVVVALPRPQHLYPLSRTRRARLAFAVSVVQAGAQLFAGVFGLVALSWIGARLGGIPFHPIAAPDFAVEVVAMAPFLPAMLWMRIYAQVRAPGRPATAMIFWLGSWMTAFFISAFPACRNWLVSPTGLAVALTALGISLFLYRAALLNFYRRGDLLQHGTSRQNLSLV